MAGHTKKLSKRKALVIIGAIGVVMAMVVVGALVWWLQHKDSGANSPAAIESPPTNVSEAQKLSITGDLEGSNKKLQEALDNPSTPNDEKYDLYIQQGVNLSNQKQYQQALEKLKQAEAIKQGFTVSHLIGEQAEALGDKKTAIEYFKKALSQLDPSAIGYISNKRVYEAKVKELGGTL